MKKLLQRMELSQFIDDVCALDSDIHLYITRSFKIPGPRIDEFNEKISETIREFLGIQVDANEIDFKYLRDWKPLSAGSPMHISESLYRGTGPNIVRAGFDFGEIRRKAPSDYRVSLVHIEHIGKLTGYQITMAQNPATLQQSTHTKFGGTKEVHYDAHLWHEISQLL